MADPRLLPAAVRRQLALFETRRRRVELTEIRCPKARFWPEETELEQLARKIAAARSLSRP
ncbi:hypothetical protein ACFV1L_33100 [Kitasatospora sp. NPDC059646]|uniref:hypothetical protein n=1 Tax=Kitasatospora sp. NPDC059646 TaxID=3346893 RepID=UPI0036791158